MATELFKPEQTLKEIHNELMEHLREESYVTINPDGRIRFYIPENGGCSWWFDDLVEAILQKAANGDQEIIQICVKEGIDLFEVKLKKK